jgi:hypothetical protein
MEYRNNLNETNWTALPLAPGNGNQQVLTDSTATNSARLYRIRTW